MNSELEDTAEEHPVQHPTAAPRVEVDCCGLSHQGLVRPNNEDHFLVARFGRFLEPLVTNITDPALEDMLEEGYAMIVADGVGGNRGGEVASALAIRTLRALVLATCDWIIGTGVPEAERVMQRMAERFPRIDAALTAQGETNPRLRDMATTMTLACSVGPSLIVANVGDSRAYLLRSGQLHQLTRDHTQAQVLLNLGVIRHLEEATVKLRHKLIRVLGSAGTYSKPDVQHLTLADHDQVLLCTDGLTDMVDDAAIAAVLREAPGATEACQRLVANALHNGGRDNVTVALARYRMMPGN
jgi:protein phosphatase